MNKPFYQINEDQATLHISQGNEKIGKGIWSFSTLPGNEEHMIRTKDKGLLTDIPGTCGKLADVCANSCYAFKSCVQHHNACVPAWAENTILLRNGKLWDELNTFLTLKNAKAIKALREGKTFKEVAELAVVKTFRINVSGEIETAQQFDHWVELAIQFPMINFGLYTKNFEALGAYLDYLAAEGLDLPDNFAIQISQWHHCADDFIAKYAERWNLGIFEYDDSFVKGCDMSEEDKARLAKIPHCPGIDKKGHHRKMADGSDFTCDKCQGRMSCYNQNYRHIAVYAH